MTETSKRPAWFAPVITGTVALIAGGAIASFGASETRVVEVEAEPEIVTEVETVTETVEVPYTPQSCLDALEDAEELIFLNGDLLEVIGDFADMTPAALEAAWLWDEAGIDAYAVELDLLADRIEVVNAVIDGTSYVENREACLSAE